MATLDTITYTNLVIGEPTVRDGATLVLGQNLTAGSVLGQITASGKVTLCNDGNADGSQNPFAVLLEDVDATSADTKCAVLLAGVVNEDALILGGTHTKDTVRVALRDVGIILKTVMPA